MPLNYTGWNKLTQIDDDCKNYESDNGDNFDACKYELCFAIDGNSKDVQGYHEYNDKGNPCRNIDALGSVPVLDDQGRC